MKWFWSCTRNYHVLAVVDCIINGNRHTWKTLFRNIQKNTSILGTSGCKKRQLFKSFWLGIGPQFHNVFCNLNSSRWGEGVKPCQDRKSTNHNLNFSSNLMKNKQQQYDNKFTPRSTPYRFPIVAKCKWLKRDTHTSARCWHLRSCVTSFSQSR